MIRFICPACSSKLKVKESSLRKSLTCPKCHEKLSFSDNASVPVVTRNLEPPPKLLGSEPSWVDAEFEELPPSREQPRKPTTAGPGESQGSVRSNEFDTDYLDDEYQWERDRQQRNKAITLTLAAVGTGLVVVLGIVIFVAKSKEQPKEIASNEPIKKSGVRQPVRESANQQNRELPQARQPLAEEKQDDKSRSESPPAPPLLPDVGPATKSKPVATDAEIDRDHGLILQYLTVKILPKGLKEPQWKGPWHANSGAKEGRLYRVRGVAKVLGDDFRQKDNLVGYYLFVFDDAVLRWQKDPGDLEKVTICQLLDSTPMTVGDVDSTSAPARPTKQTEFLSDMKAFDVHVAEGRFAQHGDLGYRAGNPQSGRILVNGNESPNGISMCPVQKGFARAKFVLPEGVETFRAEVALNDSAGTSGGPPGVGKINHPITFEVLGDSKVLWKSRPVDSAKKVQDCSITIIGIRVLELRVDSPGTWVANHAVWLEPRVVLKSP